MPRPRLNLDAAAIRAAYEAADRPTTLELAGRFGVSRATIEARIREAGGTIQRPVKPASEMPKSGIKAHGAGKGRSTKGRAPQITPETASEMGARAHTPEAVQRRYDRILSRDEIHGFWSSVVVDEDENMNYRVTAAGKLADHRYPVKDEKPEDANEIVIRGGLPDGT